MDPVNTSPDLHNREERLDPKSNPKRNSFFEKGKRERERAMAVVENAGVELGKSVGSNLANRNPETSTTPQNGGAVTAPNDQDQRLTVAAF